MEYRQLNIFDYLADNLANNKEYQNYKKEHFVNQTRSQSKMLDNAIEDKLRFESLSMYTKEQEKEFAKMNESGKAQEMLNNLEKEIKDMESKKTQYEFTFDSDNNISGWKDRTGSYVSINDTLKKNNKNVKDTNITKTISDIDIAKTISRYKVPMAIAGGLALGSLLFEKNGKR